MKIASQTYKIKGMNRDLSYSAFNPEFSWENHNIRLTARDGNDMLSVTNEKGMIKLSHNEYFLDSIVVRLISNRGITPESFIITIYPLLASKDIVVSFVDPYDGSEYVATIYSGDTTSTAYLMRPGSTTTLVDLNESGNFNITSPIGTKYILICDIDSKYPKP